MGADGQAGEFAWDGKGAWREALAGGGRVHLDRPLPFLVLNRFDADDPNSLARQVATASSAYLAWPAEDDAAAMLLAATVVRRERSRFERVLLISLHDLPAEAAGEARLERFAFQISASQDDGAQAAAERLGEALGRVEIDLRPAEVQPVSAAWFEPGVEALLARDDGLSHLALGLPAIWRVPGESGGVYPQLLHDLAVKTLDALLQAQCVFLGAISEAAPAHYRALGRSSFIDAARSVDRKMGRIAESYDFLLSVSPINTEACYQQFRADKFGTAPSFHYRPLTVDPDLARRDLYTIDLRRIEDPTLEDLYSEKRRELAQQLGMLHCRNTPEFLYSSLALYGPVEGGLLDTAKAVLTGVPARKGKAAQSETVGPKAVEKAARRMIAAYRESDPAFDACISIREDLAAGLMVSGPKLMISAHTKMLKSRVDALLQHEVGVHLLTFFNGERQGLSLFRTGLAGYEGVQEGLGVFAECAVGGLNAQRLRLLAGRVIVTAAMVDGAAFVESFRLLRQAHGFGPRTAFNIVARIYRGGGFTKDAIYLRGFSAVLDMLRAGASLEPFWLGKIAPRHVAVIDELMMRGLLRPPVSTPEFLSRPDAQARIAKMRAGTAIPDLFDGDQEPC